MPEDSARALKANSPLVVKFGDKECSVRALGIKELTEVERECVKTYRRTYLETYAENMDLLPNGPGLFEKKLEEAAKWDIGDLPPKEAYDPVRVKPTDKLKAFIASHFDLDAKSLEDAKTKRFAVALLDQGTLSREKYKGLTKESIEPSKVPYVNWWITGSYEGQLTFVWICFKKYGITKQELSDKIAEEPSLLVELSRELESASSPSVGNG